MFTQKTDVRVTLMKREIVRELYHVVEEVLEFGGGGGWDLVDSGIKQASS